MRTIFLSTSALCAVSSLVAVSPAFAQPAASGARQDAGSAIEEVIVTARRHEENLQQVPIAITALTQERLRSQNVLLLQDLQRAVPGFTATQSNRGSSSPSYSIRGQRGSASLTTLLDGSVGIYFAEFGLARVNGTNQSIYDLQSVQVLKGPQGTLFGRNSTGGAILIEPNRPSENFEGYIKGSIGNYNFHDIEGVINVPLHEKVSIRASGKFTQRDGFMKNVLTGARGSAIEAISTRLSVTIRPTDAIESRFIGTYFKDNPGPTPYKLYLVDPRGVSAALGANRQRVIDALQADLAANRALGKYEYRNSLPEGNRDRAWSVQNNTNIELGSLTIKNIVGYRRIRNDFSSDFIGGGSVDLFSYRPGEARIKGSSFSEEFQIQGNINRAKYIVGIFYFREVGNDRFVSHTNEFTGSPSRGITDTDAKNISYAAFGHVDYDLSPLLTGLGVSGGVRITKDKRRATYHSQARNGPAPTVFPCVTTGQALPVIDRNLCSRSFEVSGSKLTYDASLNYQVTPETLTYLAYRRGYRSGGLANTPPFLPASDFGVSFKPETLDEFEAGLKTDFSIGSVNGQLNAAAFYQRFTDVQRSLPNVNPATGALASFVANASKMHLSGAEAELILLPAEGVRLSVSYALIRPKYDRYVDSRPIAGVQQQIDVSDSPLLYIPEEQLNATARYTFPMDARFGEISLGVNYSWQAKQASAEPFTTNCGPSGIYLNCINTQAGLPAYSLVSLRADWRRFMNTNVELGFFMNNVTNKFYRTFSANTLSQFGTAAGNIGAPRMYGVELRAPF